uniref:Uncharacterized protein n=1 Tax=Rhizophora mucronata TaxID=61149 RepID=A0A2P2PXM1_RHIMU
MKSLDIFLGKRHKYRPLDPTSNPSKLVESTDTEIFTVKT